MRARFSEFRGDPGDQIYTFTPSAKRALQLSFSAARQMGVTQVGSEHLLLGLLGEGDGNAYRILQQHGANDAEALRREILRLMQQRGAQAGQGMPAAGGPGAPGGTQGPPSKTPVLDQVSRDLTQLAREGELDPVIGRAEEIARVVRILSRRTKNNPVLIGEAGVGKTAIAEGLAQRIVSEDIPEVLKDKRVLALDVGGLVAGTRFRGDFEERMQQMLKELQAEEKNIVLFIDELHTIVGAGGAEGAGRRRNDARRVPQARREGPCPRAPLPAGARGRADGGRDRCDPLRSQGPLRGAPQGADLGRGDHRRRAAR
jgi:ATP-dependent Clp protease ATP-binding subunit ClpC